MTPAANPVSARLTASLSVRRMKNTHPAPSDVPIKGMSIPQKTFIYVASGK